VVQPNFSFTYNRVFLTNQFDFFGFFDLKWKHDLTEFEIIMKSKKERNVSKSCSLWLSIWFAELFKWLERNKVCSWWKNKLVDANNDNRCFCFGKNIF
jgi:hypothetical protein